MNGIHYIYFKNIYVSLINIIKIKEILLVNYELQMKYFPQYDFDIFDKILISFRA